MLCNIYIMNTSSAKQTTSANSSNCFSATNSPSRPYTPNITPQIQYGAPSSTPIPGSSGTPSTFSYREAMRRHCPSMPPTTHHVSSPVRISDSPYLEVFFSCRDLSRTSNRGASRCLSPRKVTLLQSMMHLSSFLSFF